MTTQLSVNLNAVALLRNRRDLPWPSMTELGRLALEAGAAGITLHPRPDQRHVRFSDLGPIAALVKDFPKAEFNIEGYPTPDFLELVAQHRPHQVTLVPDDPSQATSDHGWDFLANRDLLRSVVRDLNTAGFRVACFADPDCSREQVEAAAELGVHRLELYTGPYAAALGTEPAQTSQLDALTRTATFAATNQLELNAGHDLTVANLPALLECVPQIREVSIGHGLTADALTYGMSTSVKRFVAALQNSGS